MTGSAHSRGYGADWRRLRAYVLAREPVCRGCKRAIATTVDHIKPKAAGGTDDLSNLQALCRDCHATKTGQDGGIRK